MRKLLIIISIIVMCLIGYMGYSLAMSIGAWQNAGMNIGAWQADTTAEVSVSSTSFFSIITVED